MAEFQNFQVYFLKENLLKVLNFYQPFFKNPHSFFMSDGRLIEFQNDHNKFLENYRTQRWDLALNFIKKWEEQVVEFDLYYAIFKDRIKDMKLNLTDPNWNGAYVATTK